MERWKNYKIRLSADAKNDIAQIKRYLLKKFHYRETAEAFSKNIKQAILSLNPFAEAYPKTGLFIQDLEVFFKPYQTYLIFFVVEDNSVTVIRVLKDRMYWQSIIQKIRYIN